MSAAVASYIGAAPPGANRPAGVAGRAATYSVDGTKPPLASCSYPATSLVVGTQMVPSGPTSAPGWSCASRLEYPVRLFCARLCSASKDSALARLVRSPAFHRALLRPPSPSPPRLSPSRFICDRFFALAVVAAMLGSALRGRGRLAAPRVLACRRLSRTPHALHSVLAPPGPLRHKGVVCVLQCAHLLPGMPGNRALASPPEPMSMVCRVGEGRGRR